LERCPEQVQLSPFTWVARSAGIQESPLALGGSYHNNAHSLSGATLKGKEICTA
jgi:hypothetical protein